MGCLRFIAIASIIACVIMGIISIAVGNQVYITINMTSKAMEVSSPGLLTDPCTIIAVGVIMFLISLLGLFAALKNIPCLLTTYAFVLFMLMVIQLLIGMVAPLITTNLEDAAKSYSKTAFQRYYHADNSTKDAIQFVQSRYECCGVHGPSDYLLDGFQGDIPGSCCGQPNQYNCTKVLYNKVGDANFYTEGCTTKMYDGVKSAMATMGNVAFAEFVAELLGATFATCLVRSKQSTIY